MTDAELWEALESLDDDFLDADMPQDIVDEELRRMGVGPETLGPIQPHPLTTKPQ